MSAPAVPGIRGRASVVDLVNVVFLTLVVAFTAVAFARTPYRVEAVLLYAGLYGVLYAVGRFRFSRVGPTAKRVVLFVYPALFLLCIFESLTFVMPWFRSARFDDWLVDWDHAVFGLHPTVWMQQFLAPWLTDALYALYFFYFPMPLFVLIPMFRRGELAAMERWIATLLVGYFGAYVVYFFVPAVGPRFHPPTGQTAPLTGLWLSEPIRRLIDSMEPNKLDAFPSLHAAILALTMTMAWRHTRRTFWIFLPLAIGIALSLVYLRYHYVIDVLAGFAWAGLAYALSRAILPRLRARSAPHFGPDAP